LPLQHAPAVAVLSYFKVFFGAQQYSIQASEILIEEAKITKKIYHFYEVTSYTELRYAYIHPPMW
jgi:hypothetical protein